VNREFSSGRLADAKGSSAKTARAGAQPQRSQAIVEGLANCYYPIADGLDAAAPSGRRTVWIEGERLAFGFYDCPQGAAEREKAAEHERFVYVLRGAADVEVDGERKRCGPGDIAHLPRASSWSLAACEPSTRYAAVASTPWLENKIDTMSAEEQARARVERKAN
jgi:hypothetical protein